MVGLFSLGSFKGQLVGSHLRGSPRQSRRVDIGADPVERGDPEQVIVDFHLLAQAKPAKGRGDAPLPFPAQREIVQASKQYGADERSQPDGRAKPFQSLRQRESKHPFLPEGQRPKVEDPTYERRAQSPIEPPGISAQTQEYKSVDRRIRSNIRGRARQAVAEYGQHAGQTETDHRERKARKTMPQENLPECGQPVPGKILVALKAPAARSGCGALALVPIVAAAWLKVCRV